jgi:asparagine synthase (glutamine-hydrolysing)
MKLMPEKQWIKKIVELEKASKKSTKKKVEKALIEAVKKSIPKRKFGVLLSGGVDSCLIALLCQQAGADFVCYTVGMKDSPDIPWAKAFAKQFKIPIKVKTFDLDEIETQFKKAKKALKHVDILSVGVGAVLLSAIELGKKDKVKDFFTGLGSEEIFAGYHHHGESADPHAECWKRLKSCWKRDLRRDYAVANATKVNLMAPFLDADLIKEAMGISIKRKISKKEKKIILREIAQDLGLPKKFAWRSKKAAQYGSWFDKAMMKLARRKGFQFKQTYLDRL